MALIIKGDMPSICKKCKSQGGLTDGSFNYICCDDNYLDFYCEGDNPNGCQILCEIPDKHGDLIDLDKASTQIIAEICQFCASAENGNCDGCLVQKCLEAIGGVTVVVEASE